ncbi:zinc finger protein-domain-containing protein [Fusarium solani]|jgi:hypothetical protein|uniref:Zinc finger protein-domain-containing protein n=1 Tax=Fusarium solani TaxID=169388 RepID=A0A9P9K4T0_FUSSL|nr:zinc finger protein-domain-containing protein [Fusarium solani]KAH7248008.1 zinc finger protein-domain-containing protein [Fusarium solani]
MGQTTAARIASRDLTTETSSEQLERIGMGFCGSVWADVNSLANEAASCMKREDGGPGRSITNEYHIHRLVNDAVNSNTRHAASFRIPLCRGFLKKSDADWSKILLRLPPGSTACNALLSEKVQPVSETARRLLAVNYAKDHDSEVIVGDKKNEHCLIRPYLGRRRHGWARRPGKPAFFSLRNFPLHIDQMEELGMPIEPYAKAMAEGLAFLLWVARVDANDVEFVLACPRPSNSESSKFEADILGPHSMWIIDFDCCNPLPMDEEGVEIAARCFWRNDPFYPRPGSSNAADERLWGIFREQFLAVSERMLEDELSCVRELPVRLMDKIMETRGKLD